MSTVDFMQKAGPWLVSPTVGIGTPVRTPEAGKECDVRATVH